ncbi:hypothetical protein [Sphingomonas hylomeconis]|uniref:Uncharacterized protein n=1 Tax=Sphingomonas hylomeconis TaxID=1395958 RepID=A0ABV7SS52_9SPHN|nr:hypothetical protein [Sphingomonas hylomeconis]
MKRMIMLAAALAVPAAATAQVRAPMSVQTFLSKVEALKAKGMMAMFSPDVKLLKAEMATVAAQLQAEKKAREAAGKPPLACPPKSDGKNKMGSEEFLTALRTIPPAQRGMSMKDGLSRVIVAKYPCPQGAAAAPRRVSR